MRTVIFFGLVTIADSIGKQTGWEMNDGVAGWGATIFVVAIAFDIIDMFRTCKR